MEIKWMQKMSKSHLGPLCIYSMRCDVHDPLHLVSCHKAYICHDLTHWGRVTHICVGKLTNIDSDNGLSPERRQAIIWIKAGILLIGPLGINFSEILIEINTVLFNKMHLKMVSAKWRLFRLSLNVLRRLQKTLLSYHAEKPWETDRMVG